jgi:glycosyltransferase involved in cell wall biosynthesis
MEDGVLVRVIRPRFWLGNAPVDPALGAALRGIVAKTRPDVILAHTPVPFAAEVAGRVARQARIPFVVTYHAGRLRGSAPMLDAMAALHRATFESRMLRSAAGLIAVSPFVRERALGRFRDRVSIVPPGVDATMFSPNGAPDGRTILFVGPLSKAYRWKGIDVLWDAFDRVRRDRPDAQLVLVGEGDRVDEFSKRASATGGAVRLAGRLSDKELASAYRACSVLVLPSTTEAESFGMVLAEANACGRPVVGSRIGGIPSFVRDGENGLLVPPGNVEALAAAIRRILDEPAISRRMGRQGRERVVKDHDWDQLSRQTEVILSDAISRAT